MATNKIISDLRERGDTAIALAILLGLFAIAGAIYFRPVTGRYERLNDTAFLDSATGNIRAFSKKNKEFFEIDTDPGNSP